MPYTDIGPKGFTQAQTVDSLSFTPQADRAAIVRDILIDKVSAADVWRVKVGPAERAAFDIEVLGNQQPLAGPYSGYPKNNDLFDVFNALSNDKLLYPVPMGQTFKVSSDGGATADIQLAYTEYRPEELSAGMLNHPLGTRIICPLVGYRAALVTDVGENTFDTQVGPSFVPNIFVDGVIPQGWEIKILAMFLEGGGRNTYNGSADHQSNTTYLGVQSNGRTLYTRENLGGIPLVGQPSATGSANTVVGTDAGPLPPFQESNPFNMEALEMPFTLGAGAQYRFRLNIAGDVTGGADYSAVRQMFLCDIRFPGVS